MNLQSCAVRLSVTINQYGRGKTDKKVTGKVLQENSAPDTAGRFNKALLPKEAYKAIEDAANAIYDFVEDNTDPWEFKADEEDQTAVDTQDSSGDKKQKDDRAQRVKGRILSMRNFATVMDGIRQLRGMFDAEAEAFVKAFPDTLEAWRKQINGLYNPADYPRTKAGDLDLRKIRKRFRVHVHVEEMPDLGESKFLGVLKDQFQVAEAHLEEVRSENARLKTEIEAQLRLSPYRRLAELLVKIIQREKQWEQLWPKVKEELGRLEKFGVADDPNFEALRKMAVEDLANAYPPGSFRDNMPARDQARDKAKAILEKMAAYV